MSKHNFLDCLCLSVNKRKIKEFCEFAEFNAWETTLILRKYCDRENIDIVAGELNMSVDQVQERAPHLCDRALSCFSNNLGFFTAPEVISMCGKYAKLK